MYLQRFNSEEWTISVDYEAEVLYVRCDRAWGLGETMYAQQ